jgi:tripartite-type tricarboxylate transporter receptor subunit TctC
MKTRLFKGFLFSAMILVMSATVGYGTEPQYPTRQIEIIVPAGPGGGTDVFARSVAQFVSKRFGQPVLVVNKPGGGMLIGTHYALKQTKPDGYSVLADTHGCSSMMVAGIVSPPAKLEDRVFISRLIVDSMVFPVKSDAPWKTFRELTEWVKTHPRELTYGGAGAAGTAGFTVNAWLTNIGMTAADARLVATSSANDTLTKVAGGHIMLGPSTVGESYIMAQAGKVRVLAVSADNRSPYMPDVPTVAEMGVPTIRVTWWAGISAPKGTPQYVIEKWAKALEEVSRDPAFLQQAKNLHLTVSYLGPGEFKDFVYKEAEYYTDLAAKIGIRK